MPPKTCKKFFLFKPPSPVSEVRTLAGCAPDTIVFNGVVFTWYDLHIANGINDEAQNNDSISMKMN